MPRHRATVMCAIVLALISGIVLNETRIVALAPIPPSARDHHTQGAVTVVTQFYARVNAAIASGDVSSLSQLLAEDFIDHSTRPSLRPEQTSLLDLVRTLHAIDPNLRLVPSEVIGQDDLVSARVQVTLADETSVLEQTVTPTRLWSVFDVFRLEGNQIIEHWDDASGLALFEQVLEVSLPNVGPARRAVTLERWTYAPGATEMWGTGLGPLVLGVDVGALTVEVWSEGNQSRRRLSLGESIVIPERGRFVVRNEEHTESVALVVQLISPVSPEKGNSGNTPTQSVPLTAPFDVVLGRSEPSHSASVPGIVHTTLAGGATAKLPMGQATLAIRRLTLAPDAGLAPHAVGNVELIAVERGTLALSLNEGDAWISLSPTSFLYSADRETITAGGGAMIEAGIVTGSPVGSHEPLELLIVTIGPPHDP